MFDGEAHESRYGIHQPQAQDKEIARVVGDFIRDASGNRIDIYLSSSPQYKGTRAGADLSSELDKAILGAGVVILVYTGKSAGVDWEYCIYECAFARSQGIRVIVLQCVDDAPAPFLSTVRTLVAEKANIFKFTKDFLTSPDFLKDQPEPVTAYSPDDPAIEEKANGFHANLTQAINEHLGRDPKPWSAWPMVRVRLARDSIAEIRKPGNEDRIATVKQELLAQGEVAASSGADQIFGIGIDPGQPFNTLVASWQESYEDQDAEWFDSICMQIEAFARKRYPVLRHCRMREVQGNSSVVPILNTMLSYPTGGEHEFEIRFYDIKAPSQGIIDVMISKEKMHCEFVESGKKSDLRLRDVYRDIKKRSINRLPVLDKSWHFRYMIHRSVISEFLLDTDIEDPVLEDILSTEEFTETFAGTVAFVGTDSTVEEAREALQAVPGARDVFITQTGEDDSPVLGMVTNTDLEKYA